MSCDVYTIHVLFNILSTDHRRLFATSTVLQLMSAMYTSIYCCSSQESHKHLDLQAVNLSDSAISAGPPFVVHPFSTGKL